MHQLYFTPGPSALYFTAESHLKEALKQQIPSISHRGESFKTLYAHTEQMLRELLGVPEDFHILFLSSATEIWERILQNTVEHKSYHLINGAFSKRFWEIGQLLGYDAASYQVPEGTAWEAEMVPEIPGAELITYTHNETSTGVQVSNSFMEGLRQRFPEALIAADIVSSAPVLRFPWHAVDMAYFSVQKGFGLPAGLGVWMVHEKALAKAEHLQNTGKSIGSYHSLPELTKRAAQNQTPETPNVLDLYLLGKVAEDMLEKGLQVIDRERQYKSAILYHALDDHPLLECFVQNPVHRSTSVIVGKTGPHTENLFQALKSKGLIVGKGYGAYKAEHLRFANFPTHSKEQFEMLVDRLTEIEL